MKKLVYVASCADDGGIYTYEWHKGEMTLSVKTPVYRPMYIANEAGKTYVIQDLRHHRGRREKEQVRHVLFVR